MNLDEKLSLCYEIIMMAYRTKLLKTACQIRTGYTHWLGPELAKEVRVFTGEVSENAKNNGTHTGLVLEHPLRIQKQLTALIRKHMDKGENEAEFVAEIKRLERVRIVTKEENDKLRRNEFSGDYKKAGIKLVHWDDILEESRQFLRRKIKGKVSNFDEFASVRSPKGPLIR
jgi:hypothetical protein